MTFKTIRSIFGDFNGSLNFSQFVGGCLRRNQDQPQLCLPAQHDQRRDGGSPQELAHVRRGLEPRHTAALGQRGQLQSYTWTQGRNR